MPRLLIINITCNQGSTGKISEQVGIMMKRRGWEVFLAHGSRRVNSSELNTIPFSHINVEYFHALKSFLFDADGLGSITTTKKLVGIIKEINPDVIQIHNLHGYYINYRVLFDYLNNTQIPIVMTLHDCWAFTGHCVHFVISGCEKWKSGCYGCELKNKYPKKTLLCDKSRRNYALKKLFFTLNPNMHIVAVSDWLGKVAQDSILKDNDIRVIPNGVDITIFQPKEKKENKTYNIIAVANVWHRDKGFYDIMDLSRKLKEDERIVLVGFIPKNLRKYLNNNIICYGIVSNQDELAMLYNDSDVVLSMSYAESFGLTVAEGFACGKPAVVYDNTAQVDLIASNTGYAVQTGDIAGVYKAIEIVRQKGHDFYRDECRRRAEECFDKDTCFMRYAEFYEQLLNSKQI